MASLLFSTMGSGGRFKNVGKSKFKVILDGVDSNLTWFTDRPDREAGSVSFSDLISQWDNGFKGVDPNSALIFNDNNGNKDTVVFEQSKPVYNHKKKKLIFKAEIHDRQKLDSISGALYDEAQNSDNNFSKKFSDFSLFVDNWFSKDTSVNFINDTDVPLRIIRLQYDAKPNWRSLTQNALNAGLQWNYGYEQKSIQIDGFDDWQVANRKKGKMREWSSAGKYAVTSFKDSAKASIINSAVSVGTELIHPTTKSTPRYDEIIDINPGQSHRITDVRTQFGFNDVKDVGVIVGRVGEYPADFVTLAFDNPMVGKPKGYIKPLATKFDKAVTSAEQVWSPGDPKVSSFNLLNGTDKLSIEYFGDIQMPDSSYAKGWDVHFENL